jgi:hypothetical protein
MRVDGWCGPPGLGGLVVSSTWRVWARGSQAYLWPSDTEVAGVCDMMIDRVTPARGCGRSVS